MSVITPSQFILRRDRIHFIMDGYDASPSYPILWYTVLSMSILCMYVCTWNQKKKAYPSSAKRTQITRSHEYQTKQTGVGRQGERPASGLPKIECISSTQNPLKIRRLFASPTSQARVAQSRGDFRSPTWAWEGPAPVWVILTC